MKTKYIFISGGVISGIGKGITSASLSLLLQSCGYKVAPLKFEGYLNIDAGTINPIKHGDAFLCEDGTEADMDIGTYEKFLNQDMSVLNFCTMGSIYKAIIEKERRFEYNGQDVEAKHITQEIIQRIKNLETAQNPDIIAIELGGTAGEYWNVFYYEAARQLAFKNPGDVMHVHVSYVPKPDHLGEPKTKPLQLSVRTLNSLGIQPDFVVARSESMLDAPRIERISESCNILPEYVISNPNVESVYEIPEILASQNMHTNIFKKLGLPTRSPNLDSWKSLTKTIKEIRGHEKTIEIAIIGKYFETGQYHLRDAYAALFDAIDHASYAVKTKIKTHWISAQVVEQKGAELIGRPHGIIVPIGWGERGAEGMIAAASYARSQKIPYLGLCYGMQLAVVAFARDVLGWSDANTAENTQDSKHLVVHMIESQKDLMSRRAYGGTMRLGRWEASIKPNSLVAQIYTKHGQLGADSTVWERHRHRYEVNNQFASQLEDAGLVISGRSKVEGLVEFIELPRSEHPFYVATQGHPEYKSLPLKPHPLFVEFAQACKNLAGML